MKEERIREIARAVSVSNHGDFLRAFFLSVCRADGDNFQILKPTSIKLIQKYKLDLEYSEEKKPDRANHSFYFTFGFNHKDKSGKRLKNSYVRVVAPDWDKARVIFLKEFAYKELSKSDHWNKQHTEETFKPDLYPEGEILCIESSIK